MVSTMAARSWTHCASCEVASRATVTMESTNSSKVFMIVRSRAGVLLTESGALKRGGVATSEIPAPMLGHPAVGGAVARHESARRSFQPRRVRLERACGVMKTSDRQRARVEPTACLNSNFNRVIWSRTHRQISVDVTHS